MAMALINSNAVLQGEALGMSDVDFSKPGPCTWTTKNATFPVPKELQKGLGKTLPVFFTIPTGCRDGTTTGVQSPFPLLIFYNGFQLQASYYTRIVKHAASWGYVVMQYNLPMFSLSPAIYEVKAFNPLLQWAQSLGITQIDTKVVLAGHSRGGKLAALNYGNNPTKVAAAWLIDPIDSSTFSQISAENPSGVEAVRGKLIGVEGAGIRSSCNPTQGNYQKFYAAGKAGSWKYEIPKASHSTFSDSGTILNIAQDALCGKGGITRAQAANLTATPMLAWFYKNLEKPGTDMASVDPLAVFYAWVERKEAEGVVKFIIKKTPAAKTVKEAAVEHDAAVLI
jgi:pimeloyl-ACP methyl ester carboxylesterase